MHEKMGDTPCPFCRQFTGGLKSTQSYFVQRRVEIGDVEAILHQTKLPDRPDYVVVRDLFKAASKGSAESCFLLAKAFYFGEHGLHSSKEKAEKYFEMAVARGYEGGVAHFYLGCMDFDEGRLDLAFGHWVVALAAGCGTKINVQCGINIRHGIRLGLVRKSDYELALRLCQLREDSTRTEERRLARKSANLVPDYQKGNTCVAEFTGDRPLLSVSNVRDWLQPVNRYWGLDDEDAIEEDEMPQLEIVD